MVVLGYPGTEPVSMDEMLILGKAVRRGLRTPLMVGDMPMGSYESSNELAIQNAQRLVKETGCQVVKLEAGGTSVERARAIVRSGIPVMGHVGLTPQTATALGGYKTQGKTAQSAIKLCEDALALQSVGCFAIVFEAVPAAITEAIVEQLEIPAIGIGAGPSTAGQVLVFHDLLGITTGRMAEIRQALRRRPRRDGRRRRPLRRARSARGTSPNPTTSTAIEPGRARRVPPTTSTRRAWPRRRPGTGSRSPDRLRAAARTGQLRRDSMGRCRSMSSSARSAGIGSRSWLPSEAAEVCLSELRVGADAAADFAGLAARAPAARGGGAVG